MNTTSERAARGPRLLGALAALLAFGGCIQGPWDYYPEDPPVFKGIWLSGYAVAGRPLTQVCMESFHGMGEEFTDAFAFYDSATVEVAGRFGDPASAARTLALARRGDAPNCFAGDSAALVLAGQSYDLTARVAWDSAGKRVVSTLTARARVPATFDVKSVAVAPRYAVDGPLPPNVLSPDFRDSLPEEVRNDAQVSKLYSDGEKILASGDTAALRDYIVKNLPILQKRLGELLAKYQTTYDEGDTLYYLSGVLNPMSHYYTSTYSADVGGVLITHRFDSTAGSPQTAFEGIFNIEPDSSEFYVQGSMRRLGLYPAATSPKGYNLLDSIGVVNAWFKIGFNRLYFYGMEDAYLRYGQTVFENEGNPRVKAQYNVQGGAGYFVGGVVDSFDLYIRPDGYTNVYSLPAVHAYACREDGWYSGKDCSTYYRPYCAEKGWAPEDCAVDAVNADLAARWAGDSLLADSLHAAAASGAARADSLEIGLGTERFCVENGFPDFEGACDASRQACGQPGINGCKESLWDFCKDAQWGPPQCDAGLAWYCRDKGRTSETMCRQADAFCRDNPGDAACR